MLLQNIDVRVFHRPLLALFALTAVLGFCTCAVHYAEPTPEPLDLVMAPLATLLFSGLFVCLILRPDTIVMTIYLAVAGAILALSVPAWYYSLVASFSPDIKLITIYPPISSLLMLLMMVITVLFPPRPAFVLAFLSWSLSGVPILSYLFVHTDELWLPRGKEMVITYGPALMLMLVLVPFHHRLRRKLVRLQLDNTHMQQLAERDALTHEYNRRGGERLLKQFLAEGLEGCIIMLDIDHFKPINDIYGHPIGDRVLQQFAARVRGAIRNDANLIRWGGEEFLVLAQGVEERGLKVLAERLRQAVNTCEFPPAGRITTSCGATIRRETDTLDSLVERADQALYQAKVKGRDCVVCI